MSERFQDPPAEVAAQLAQSKLYGDTAGQAGSRAYFAFEDHEGLDLAGAVLVEATLQQTSFARSRLDGATLHRALANGIRLDWASLVEVDFSRAELVAARITGASGERAVFAKAALRGARLDQGLFPQADFRAASCLDASFQGSLLDGANFSRAVLDGADFSGASLFGADFSGAVLSSATRFRDCRGLDQIVVDRIVVGESELEGQAARDAIARLASASS